jgi:hypothetical protein
LCLWTNKKIEKLIIAPPQKIKIKKEMKKHQSRKKEKTTSTPSNFMQNKNC